MNPEPARFDDRAEIAALLVASSLPIDGLDHAFPDGYVVIRGVDGIDAVAGLERHGAFGLLRSVAVKPTARRAGLGQVLVADRLDAASDLDAVYLLTTTAAEYFRRMGFVDELRAAVPEAIRAAPELMSICPSSATLMVAKNIARAETTIYRRTLPESAIAFSSAEGRRVFGEALAAGGMDGYFPLAEQFHTQSEPAYCGLGSLVVALNALAIDPGRLWKGPWRWFGEEMLDCCVPLAEIRQRGLEMGELACLARCNGARALAVHANDTNLEAFRAALMAASRGEAVLIASYDRSALGQTGSGHFSPLGGYHRGRDLALVLDVARFKYPAHWLSTEQLWRAMQPLDPATNKPRGWLVLTAVAR
jgi:glutathione gamma-glutamylcysteinyltransferase